MVVALMTLLAGANASAAPLEFAAARQQTQAAIDAASKNRNRLASAPEAYAQVTLLLPYGTEVVTSPLSVTGSQAQREIAREKSERWRRVARAIQQERVRVAMADEQRPPLSFEEAQAHLHETLSLLVLSTAAELILQDSAKDVAWWLAFIDERPLPETNRQILERKLRLFANLAH